MSDLTFITASEDSIRATVYVIYSCRRIRFVVQWNYDDESDGWDLDTSVICSNGFLRERVESAIQFGEDDSNENLDIYLFIRDTFDSGDCTRLIEQKTMEE